MTAAARLIAARQAGLFVRLDGDEIKVEGPTTALDRWVPALREVKTALPALLRQLVPEVEIEPTASLEPEVLTTAAWPGFPCEALRTAAGEDCPKVEDKPAALVALAGLLHTADQGRRGEVGGEAFAPEPDTPAAPVVPAAVACRTCLHWRRDQVGDGGGLGRCLAHAPASLMPGSLWPGSTPDCGTWEGA